MPLECVDLFLPQDLCCYRVYYSTLFSLLTNSYTTILTCHNIQVSSAVPEGKGVSSSASVEVASMSAIAAAHGTFTIHMFQS